MKVEKIFNGSVITVADPDLQIRGVPVIQTPEIRDGGGLQKFFSALWAPVWSKIRHLIMQCAILASILAT